MRVRQSHIEWVHVPVPLCRAANSGKGLTFATFGLGSAAHLSAERFRLSAKFEAVQVFLKGAPAALLEVMEGRVDFCFCGVGTSLPFIRDGKLVALAVSTPRRSPLLPDVPTTLEAGFPNSDYTAWLGLFAPAHTPATAIQRMHDEVAEAVKDAEMQTKLAKLATDPVAMSVAEFNAFVRRDAALNKTLIGELGLQSH
jgi:tripartite-type tricarboxylate transporter receptor subunit TctC